jgi:hypothetical protein
MTSEAPGTRSNQSSEERYSDPDASQDDLMSRLRQTDINVKQNNDDLLEQLDQPISSEALLQKQLSIKLTRIPKKSARISKSKMKELTSAVMYDKAGSPRPFNLHAVRQNVKKQVDQTNLPYNIYLL